MLIKCPECGKEVSDKSNQCIHCGFPLEDKTKEYSMINGKQYDFDNIIDKIKAVDEPALGWRMISDFLECKIAPKDLKAIYDTIISTGHAPAEYNCGYSPKIEVNTPKCPTCGSANIEEITGLERGSSLFMFGVFSKKINKSFKCKNCKYTW